MLLGDAKSERLRPMSHTESSDRMIVVGLTRVWAPRREWDPAPIEYVCWRALFVTSDGTVYQGEEMSTPIGDCPPEIQAAAKSLPRTIKI